MYGWGDINYTRCSSKVGKYVVKLEKLALEAEIDTVVKRGILVNGLNKKSTN